MRARSGDGNRWVRLSEEAASPSSSPGAASGRHLDAYRDHVLAAAIPARRKREPLGSVILLHSYRDLLPGPCRMATADPWGGARGDALVVVPAPGRVNKTPRIASATMEALLAWSLRMLEDSGPDVAEALRTWHELRAGEHPDQSGFAGLPIRDRLARFLAAAGPDTVLPGRRAADGRLVLDEHVPCRLLGLDSTYGALRSGPQRRMVAASGLPIADGCPLQVPIAGRIDGRPWREIPITTGELPDLVRVLTAALFTVVCYLSGMRLGEVLNLRRGCRATDPDTGELLLLGRRGKRADRTPHPGAGPASDEQARPWSVVQPVHDAVALLERLTPHPLLFPPGYGRTPPRDPVVSARSSIGHRPRHSRPARLGQPHVRPGRRRHANSPGSGEEPARLPVPSHPRLLHRAASARADRRSPSTRAHRNESYSRICGGRRHLLDGRPARRTAGARGRPDRPRPRPAGARRTRQRPGRRRIPGPDRAGSPFAGWIVTGVRNAERLLARADPNIHHGQGMTCVWARETAACHQNRLAAGLPDTDIPDETKCHSACTNLSHTDRDIHHLRQQLPVLEARAGDVLAPRPPAGRHTAALPLRQAHHHSPHHRVRPAPRRRLRTPRPR